MKRTALIVVFLLSMSLLGHAQMRIGVKGGLNVATLSGYENALKKLQTGKTEVLGIIGSVSQGHVVNITQINVVEKLSLFGGGIKSIISTNVWNPANGNIETYSKFAKVEWLKF